MKQFIEYKNGNSMAYVDSGDSDGFPVFIQHGLIASINDQHLFKKLIETGPRLISIARLPVGSARK